ncbi:MAG: NAD(P) transhydrogenase subunit alpha [Alphaproteobacteria bacterium]|nr:NAD(P) transhydrogenase subunit alpha [Alphaproteobacteria bacterium]
MIFLLLLNIFIFALLIGYYAVQNVTQALYSPLMSVSNAISGVVIIGALWMAAVADTFNVQELVSLLAVFFAGLNIFGGFAVSERMLKLFKKKDKD